MRIAKTMMYVYAKLKFMLVQLTVKKNCPCVKLLLTKLLAL